MRRCILLGIFLTGFLVVASPIIGEEPRKSEKAAEVQIPDPVALQANWWGYFQGDSKTVASRIVDFDKKLDADTKDVSAKNQEQVKSLLGRIRKSLPLYLQSLQPIEVKASAPSVYADHYSIVELIEVFEQRRLIANELATNQEDEQKKEGSLAAARTGLEKLKKDYAGIHDPSEEKLLIGLQIIAYQLEIGIAQGEVTQLGKQGSGKVEDLRRRNAELTYALQHLSVTEQQLEVFKTEISKAQVIWDFAREELAKKESEKTPSLPSGSGDTTVARQQLAAQELIGANIADAMAHHHLEFLRLEFALASMIFDPSSSKPESLYKHVVAQGAFLSQLQRQMQGWQEDANRQVQRSGQALPLIVEQDSPAAHEAASMLKKALRLGQENLLSLQKLSNEMEESRFLLDQLDARVTDGLGTHRKELMEVVTWLSDAVSHLTDWFTTPLFYLGSTALTALGILKFLAVVLVAIWLARTVSATLTRVAQQRIGVRKSLIYRINRLIHYSILILGVFIAFATLGFDFSSLLLVAGAIGVGLGFGVQAIVNNFLSGIIILFESHLRVGDFIELEDGSRGEIREINIRSTTITTNDGVDILIPNSQLLNSRVSNWTLSDPFRRVHIPFSVAYGTDKELVTRVVTEAALELPYTMGKGVKSDPKVYLKNLGDYGLEFELVVWVDEMASTRTRYTLSDYLWKIESSLRQNGIEIPFPRYDVELHRKNRK